MITPLFIINTIEEQKGGSHMTLYGLIEGIYNQYLFDVASPDTEKRIISEIRTNIRIQWPLIENLDGINLNNNDSTHINISINERLLQEFIDKYPEAMV